MSHSPAPSFDPSPVARPAAALLASRRGAARRVGDVLAAHPDVSAVLVFGSVATGEVDELSDVDLLAISHVRVPPLPDRRAILGELGTGWVFRDRRDTNRLFADRDSDGIVEGVPVTVHYQTAPWISAVLDRVLGEGATTTRALPFRPYTLPGLLQRGWLLVDKDSAVARWRDRAAVFPDRLRANLLRRFVPILRAHTEELVAAAERGLGPRVFVFHLDRAVDALFGVLWAINDVYDPADKRAELTLLPRLQRAPPDLPARLGHVLRGPFDLAGANERALLLRQLSDETTRLARSRGES